MDINIDSKAIEDEIVKAITDSAIGEQVKKAVHEVLNEKEKSWDSETIFNKSIKGEIERQVSIILRKEIELRQDEIREIVIPLLTDKVITEMSSNAIEWMLRDK